MRRSDTIKTKGEQLKQIGDKFNSEYGGNRDNFADAILDGGWKAFGLLCIATCTAALVVLIRR